MTWILFLHVHELSFSAEEVIINPDIFHSLALYDILEIVSLSRSLMTSS